MSPAGVDRPGRRLRTTLLVALGVLGADQITKSLAVSRLSSGSVHVIGPFALVLSYNTGVAFSIGTGLGLPIVLIVVIILALVAWFGRTVPNLSAAVGVGMILGGATGNLADRLFRGHHGAVVDFVYSGFWPTFNLADASIVCGCIVLALALFRATGRSPKTGDEAR
ncbi:MAG: signal peptidase II [Acidimicrobiales bacterium]